MPSAPPCLSPPRPLPPGPSLPWLALDTSTEWLCVAAGVGGRCEAHQTVGGAQASVALIPTARQVLARMDLRLGDVHAIAYTQGPGAFTGLRTSCAVAQGLGLALGRHLWPLDSLMLVAEDARAQVSVAEGSTVWVAMDARMQQIYAAAYTWTRGRWAVDTPPMLCSSQDLHALWAVRPAATVAGSALGSTVGSTLGLDPGAARCVPMAQSRAHALGRLAVDALLHAPGCDPADALPLYLRDKVALTTAERAGAV